MKIKCVLKIMLTLCCAFLFNQIIYAVCNSASIEPFTDNRYLHDVEQETIRGGNIEVCKYKIKYSHENDAYYLYTLLSVGDVVYCGITSDLRKRALEHSNVSGENYKVFDQMIATYYFNEDTARKKEMSCVREYNPKYNNESFCPYKFTIAGGEERYIE